MRDIKAYGEVGEIIWVRFHPSNLVKRIRVILKKSKIAAPLIKKGYPSSCFIIWLLHTECIELAHLELQVPQATEKPIVEVF